MMRLIVGMTGATGAPVAVKVLEALQLLRVETHLIMSQWGSVTLQTECGQSVQDVRALASVVHDARNLAAPVSSGSFRHDGMLVVPCSTKSLASIRIGLSDNLITRAADVTLKERRKLVLAVRETPFNSIHLENMLALSNMGVTIYPLMPAYYLLPTSMDDVNTQMAARLLDQFGLVHPDIRRWDGLKPNGATTADGTE
ncbi:UbiX family flavin prenyltransferase [Robbsia andropogonis]|nr:UbiX family flavin prenyltransferase [Robbsia andropogonis]MCP1129815.1 UbiX family flavin prenyltransferase [Robbsia andropogonis]